MSGGLAEASAEASSDLLAASARRRRRKPGAKWDGRVSDLSLKEFRERKWGIDAAFGKTSRGGPAYSFRPAIPLRSKSTTNTILPVDPVAAFNAIQRKDPSYSMGAKEILQEKELTMGPGKYKIPSSLDRKGNPQYAKHTGVKFGTERLVTTEEGTPAPGDYDHEAFVNMARIKNCPAYTAPGREAWKEPTLPPNPGPGEYKFDHCDRAGKRASVEWTAQGKTEPLEKPRGSRRYINPGPPHYNPPGAGASMETIKPKAQSFRFGYEPRGLT